MDDAVLPADLVEQHLGGREAKAVGEHLAVIGEDFFGDSVAGQRTDEGHTPGRLGPDQHPGAHAEPSVVVDAGDCLAFCAVGSEGTPPTMSNCQSSIGSGPFPTLVIVGALALGPRHDQATARPGTGRSPPAGSGSTSSLPAGSNSRWGPSSGTGSAQLTSRPRPRGPSGEGTAWGRVMITNASSPPTRTGPASGAGPGVSRPMLGHFVHGQSVSGGLLTRPGIAVPPW